MESFFTSGSVESSSAAVAFEMLRFLVGNEKLEILKVALAYTSNPRVSNPIPAQFIPGYQKGAGLQTVIAPGPREHLFDIGMAALLFAHLGGARGVVFEGLFR